jgi:hypothetical protein
MTTFYKVLEITAIYLIILVAFQCALALSEATEDLKESEKGQSLLQSIEGKVIIEGDDDSWIAETVVVVDGGKYRGFLKSNGGFIINRVPPGSYLVEVVSPNHVFEPARVDISSKTGKIRARKANILRPTQVLHLPYPLRFKAEEQAQFFEKRESWSMLSMLKNPMILLLVAPVILMLIVPKLMKSVDPEYQKEMQDSMNMFQQPGSSMPSLEEMFTNMFGSGGSGQSNKAITTGAASSTKKIKGGPAKRPRR